MSNNLVTGITFAYNAISQDYCLSECVASLKEFCDEVIVLDAGSTDGTSELIKTFQDRTTKVILCDNSEWVEWRGREKLSYFTNKAISEANTEWIYYQQADEITHEKSYEWVRRAADSNSAEAFLISRINLWGSPYKQLNVEQARKPCSTEVVRLTKSYYGAYDDAESIGAPASSEYMEHIRMYHMGFVRDKKKHVAKIRHMQAEVFGIGVDPKLEGMTVFDGSQWFDYKKDLVNISEPLPALIRQWAKDRE